jgi:hypothetical protein
MAHTIAAVGGLRIRCQHGRSTIIGRSLLPYRKWRVLGSEWTGKKLEFRTKFRKASFIANKVDGALAFDEDIYL